MNVGQLREALAEFDDLTPVCLQVLIWGQYVLTRVVDLTLIDVSEAGYSSGTVGVALRP